MNKFFFTLLWSESHGWCCRSRLPLDGAAFLLLGGALFSSFPSLILGGEAFSLFPPLPFWALLLSTKHVFSISMNWKFF